MQPNFRANYDAWHNTQLENMDNRNLSEKEREALNATIRASMVKKQAQKGGKTVRESEADDDVNEQGLNPKEMKIVRQERKKRIINHMLCQTINMVDFKKFNNITTKSWWERLMHTAPSVFTFDANDKAGVPFHLVRDSSDKFPSFERNLYGSLDYDLLILIIGYVNLLDQLTGNPMLAICLAYFIERFFR